MLSDDHSYVRRGLRNILESTNQYEICGEASDGNQTLELARSLHPDILIIDISMPAPNGLEVVRQLHQSLPEIKVLILTMHDSAEMLRAAAAAGAYGYLLKSDDETLLVDALQRLKTGEHFVSPCFDADLAEQLFQ
jgi:two-component system, NarL family, invasion response regulator UvrY